MHNAFIGIGSNLGSREGNIRTAIRLIQEKCRILSISSLYETEPVGYREQDWFLNCAIELKTELNPKELLDFLQLTEKKLGRVKTIKNGPRTIDLDILFYGDRIINENNLIVPHPRLHERLFALEPLEEISPGFIHPVLRKSISELHSILIKSKISSAVKKALNTRLINNC